MDRKKVKDIAKQLNAKSKRIIEKLEEIDIKGKGPMSVLEEDEIKKLYTYIGYIVPEKKEEKKIEKKESSEDKKKSEKHKPNQHKGQYIIRRTEVIVDEDKKTDDKKKKKSYVVSSDDSGLMPGLQRASKYSKRKKASNSTKKREELKKKSENNKKIADKTETKKPELKNQKDKKEADSKKQKQVEKSTVVKVENKKSDEKIKKETIIKEEKINKDNKKIEIKQEKKTIEDKKVKEKNNTQKTKAKEDKKIEKKESAENNKSVTKEHKDIKESKKAEDKKIKTKNKDEKVSKMKPKKDSSKNKKENVKKDKNKKSDSKINKDEVKAKKPESKTDDKKTENKKTSSKKVGSKTYTKTKSATKAGSGEITSKNEDKKLKDTARMFSNKKKVKKALSKETELDYYSKSSKRRRSRRAKNSKPKERQKPAIPGVIEIEENISIKELATLMKKTASSVITKLMNLGVMATLNDTIDFDTATLVAEEFDIKTELKEIETEEDILFDNTKEKEENLESRPPVVVVMGHVDHGKTSVLDAIKSTRVMDTEAGGITQHIGAYMVNINGKDITFLDTPGHEAFTSLRARGAQVTDIAVLVVAADDGIMPQTIEAINHAKAAGVEIIIAINKIDKANANVEKVKQELTEYELVPEEWGGETICVPISALKNENIDGLLEMITLTSEMLELKASSTKQAKGTVIESRLDKAKGAIATLLIQRGTLKEGDSIVTGTTVGRIRSMSDYKGMKITQAPPSTPVEIFGLSDVPTAGEIFYAVEDYKTARQLVDKRKAEIREEELKKKNAVTLDDFFEKVKEGETKELNIIVKADVQGSLEALRQSLSKLSNEEVKVKVVHAAVGTITETDVSLAQVSNAIIIGFNVRPPATVTEIAKENGIDLRLYSIIYEALDDVENAMKGLLDPKYREKVTGHAEVRDTFKVSGVGTIAGCYVQDGKVVRSSKVRLVRDGIVIHDGELNSLKRFKDDVKEVASGYECGLSLENFNDIKIGDVIEAYQMEEVER